MERMEAMFQEQQEISQRQQVQNQAEKDALQKQVDEMSKKLEKLEKEYKKDGGKPVDIGALVALEADEVENAAGIREENQAKQDNFNFDMEDRMSRLYTHVAGLDERIAAQEKNHDRTEGLVHRLAAKKQSRRRHIELLPEDRPLMPPRRSLDTAASHSIRKSGEQPKDDPGGTSQHDGTAAENHHVDAYLQRQRERQAKKDAQHEKGLEELFSM
mmetsp:Transcript_3093/g.6919  ORF Transcript_3093/g.6919 Transcript_3093/m.6919 type:complete len:215 (-) Transcript_3093:2252-2896(-)